MHYPRGKLSPTRRTALQWIVATTDRPGNSLMIMKTPPIAANDNHPITRAYLREQIRIATPPAANDNGAAERLRAALDRPVKCETPFEKEIREKRIPRADELTALWLEDLLERATRTGYHPVPSSRATEAAASYGVQINGGWRPGQLEGAEIYTDANRLLDPVKEAAGHNWRAIEMALLERQTMQAIGVAYRHPVRVAAAQGRQRVLTGLRAVAEVYWGDPLLAAI